MREEWAFKREELNNTNNIDIWHRKCLLEELLIYSYFVIRNKSIWHSPLMQTFQLETELAAVGLGTPEHRVARGNV